MICTGCGCCCYLDPKVVACTLIQDQGRVLLVKRAEGKYQGLWNLPGGFVDRGEPPEEAACRECLEETGLVVEVGSLMGIFSERGQVEIVLTYEAHVLSGRLEAGEEASDIGWFGQNDIPWGSLAFDSTRRSLKHLFERDGSDVGDSVTNRRT